MTDFTDGQRTRMAAQWNAYREIYYGDTRVDCPYDSVITHAYSTYGSGNRRREWTFQCHRFNGWGTDTELCNWSYWANWLEEDFALNCGEQHVLAGVKIASAPYSYDKRYSFKCCRWRPFSPAI